MNVRVCKHVKGKFYQGRMIRFFRYAGVTNFPKPCENHRRSCRRWFHSTSLSTVVPDNCVATKTTSSRVCATTVTTTFDGQSLRTSSSVTRDTSWAADDHGGCGMDDHRGVDVKSVGGNCADDNECTQGVCHNAHRRRSWWWRSETEIFDVRD